MEIAILDYVRSYYKMKVLAIDTSNYVMGVSLIEEGNVIGEIITNLTK
ncbi:tRNA (adenosine(37)-N6)-threonylcarbamoyltransferase complex dimerization subunit type 1 TsaB, partial [Priestia megaterium]|nr:tRNA (adenosine(37)-N6)-threonylcarbamoyltransferase complex dimerization subunit type 1 TsaB [Priestia megaterium]